MPRGRPKASDRVLLEAGLSLADEQGLARMTVDAVIERAGTGKGTFYRHFGDRRGFVLALHAELRERVWTAAVEAMADYEPGAPRLTRGLPAYLDACLDNRALKAFVTEARAADSLVAASVEQELAKAAEALHDDFAALLWSDPSRAARLFVAMAHDIALAEQRVGAKDQRLRTTLLEMVLRVPS